jgi:hypothetical protein
MRWTLNEFSCEIAQRVAGKPSGDILPRRRHEPGTSGGTVLDFTHLLSLSRGLQVDDHGTDPANCRLVEWTIRSGRDMINYPVGPARHLRSAAAGWSAFGKPSQVFDGIPVAYPCRCGTAT